MEFSHCRRAASRETPSAARQRVLQQLLEAYEDALVCGQDPGQFALQLLALRGEGVPDTLLRRLLAEGLAVHARETTRSSATKRSMTLLRHSKFSDQSCFTLAPAALALIGALVRGDASAPVDGQGNTAAAGESPAPCPSFVLDATGHRELRMEIVVVKRFLQRSENQELVLAAFQELGWQRHILDPISPTAGINPKRRLRDTIAKLNRHQVEPLLRFHGDGTGQGVSWEALADAVANPASTARQHQKD